MLDGGDEARRLLYQVIAHFMTIFTLLIQPLPGVLRRWHRGGVERSRVRGCKGLVNIPVNIKSLLL